MTPKTEQELAEAIKSSVAKGSNLRIVGGGSKQALGNTVQADNTLNTTAMSGISIYEPGALTLVAAAGTPLKLVENVLDSENQRLAFEPMKYAALLGSFGEPTIGGVVACNSSGPRRIQAGACRDSLIGIRMVDGIGQTIKNGGRVMKNVTGYDLVKLLAGSFGALGVLTEAAFKVLPKPEMVGTLIVAAKDADTAVHAMSAALGSPYDVTAAAFLPNQGVMIRLEGFEDMITYRSGKLKELLGRHGDIEIRTDARNIDALWNSVKEVESLQTTDGDLWRISVKPSDGTTVLSALNEILLDYAMDWGGGLIWARTLSGSDVREKLRGIAGYAQCLLGEADYFPPLDPVTSRIEEGLQAKFNPHGILNAGIKG